MTTVPRRGSTIARRSMISRSITIAGRGSRRGTIGTAISRKAAASPIMTGNGIDGGCEGGLTRIG
jgi:hypothetical protein